MVSVISPSGDSDQVIITRTEHRALERMGECEIVGRVDQKFDQRNQVACFEGVEQAAATRGDVRDAALAQGRFDAGEYGLLAREDQDVGPARRTLVALHPGIVQEHAARQFAQPRRQLPALLKVALIALFRARFSERIAQIAARRHCNFFIRD